MACNYTCKYRKSAHGRTIIIIIIIIKMVISDPSTSHIAFILVQ